MHRVNSLIQSTLATLINREFQEFRSYLLTITHIETSKDLSYAKVYFLLHDESKEKEVLDLLGQYAHEFQKRLNTKIRLRKIPKLSFYPDATLKQGIHISQLLEQEEKQLDDKD